MVCAYTNNQSDHSALVQTATEWYGTCIVNAPTIAMSHHLLVGTGGDDKAHAKYSHASPLLCHHSI